MSRRSIEEEKCPDRCPESRQMPRRCMEEELRSTDCRLAGSLLHKFSAFTQISLSNAGLAPQPSFQGKDLQSGLSRRWGGWGRGERCGGWEQCVEILKLSSCLLIWFGITLKSIPGKKCEKKLLRKIRPKLS